MSEFISRYSQIRQRLFPFHSRTRPQRLEVYKSFPRPAERSCRPQKLLVSLPIGRKILTLEIDLRMIEQQNFERTTIVLVDDTSASINKVLYRYSLDTSVFTTYLIQSEEQHVHKSPADKR